MEKGEISTDNYTLKLYHQKDQISSFPPIIRSILYNSIVGVPPRAMRSISASTSCRNARTAPAMETLRLVITRRSGTRTSDIHGSFVIGHRTASRKRRSGDLMPFLRAFFKFFIDNLRWYTIYYILARLALKGGTLKNVQNISAQKAAEKKRARFPQKNVDQKRA